MKSPSLKRTRILGIVALVAIAGLAWFFLLSSRIGEPAILEETARASVEQSASLKAQVALMQKQAESLPQAEQVADIITRRFPSTADAATIIEQVQAAATRAGLNPADIGITPGTPTLSGDPVAAPVAPPPPADPAAEGAAEADPNAPAPVPVAAATPLQTAELPIVINASGNLDQMTQFIVQLQTSDTIIVVEQISFTAAPVPTETTTTVINPDGTTTITPIDIPTETQYTVTVNAYVPLIPALEKLENVTLPAANNDNAGAGTGSGTTPTVIAPDLSNPPAPSSKPEKGFG